MKRKLKLAFDELEKELTIIAQSELAYLMGGNGSGLSSDASISDVVSYLNDIGFPMEQDSSGNYFFNSSGNAILIEEVLVMGYSTGNGSGDDQSGLSGYSSGSSGGMGDMDYMSTVISNLQSYGYSFSYSNGSYTYHSNNNEQTSSGDDPWKREYGKLFATRTEAESFVYDMYGSDMTMKEYTITTKDGKESMKVYRVASVIDSVTGLPRDPTAAESANCLGYALTGSSDFWMLDNSNTTGNDEGQITHEYLTTKLGYTVTTNKSEASLVVVYAGGAIHAVVVNSDGTYSAKGGGGQYLVRTGMTESEFYRPYPNSENKPNYSNGTRTYNK